MATIREKRHGVWEVRVFTGRSAAGRPTQASRTVHGTKREAKRVAAALESKPPSQPAGRTVGDVLSSWLETGTPVWSVASRRDYAGRVRAILGDPVGGIRLGRLGVGDVERWHVRMRGAKIGESAIRARHAVLRAALGQAVRWGWMATNPASSARLRFARQTPREAMSADDVRRVLAAAASIDPAAALALRLAAIGGLRRAELAALRWDDVKGETLHVTKSAEVIRDEEGPEVREAPTKTSNRRRLRLDPETLAAIESQRVIRSVVSPYMFSLTESPPKPDRIGWWWTRARALSGIDRKWRLHDMRHWSATMSIASGHDVRTVANRLGHANAAMTLRVYAHAVEAADRAVADTLGAYLDGDRSDE